MRILPTSLFALYAALSATSVSAAPPNPPGGPNGPPPGMAKIKRRGKSVGANDVSATGSNTCYTTCSTPCSSGNSGKNGRDGAAECQVLNAAEKHLAIGSFSCKCTDVAYGRRGMQAMTCDTSGLNLLADDDTARCGEGFDFSLLVGRYDGLQVGSEYVYAEDSTCENCEECGCDDGYVCVAHGSHNKRCRKENNGNGNNRRLGGTSLF